MSHVRFGRGTVMKRLDGKAVVRFDDGVERTLAEQYLSKLDE